MQFSNDEQHAQTLDFLAEVRDYLATWPAHPMNRAMIQRIEQHLDDPIRHLARQAKQKRSGTVYTPDGIPVISARLVGDQLTVTVRAEQDEIPQEELLERLRKGEVLALDLDE